MVSEWIEGGTVKQVIRDWNGNGERNGKEEEEEKMQDLLKRVGRAVGRLHGAGVIHGDLTTSNMMLRRKEGVAPDEGGQQHALDGEIVLIDFGLATQAMQEEDRAVDLYVLERAFGSTHPKEEKLFDRVLEGYGETFKGAKATLRKLEDVRMRGRKKSMIG